LQQAFQRDFRFPGHFLLQLNNSLLNLNIFRQSGASGFGRMIGGAIAGYTVSLSRVFPLRDLLGKTLVAHIFKSWHYRFQSCKRFSMRLCWADKIPLVVFGLITVVLLVLQCLGKVRDPPFLCIHSHAILLLRHIGASLSRRVGNGPGLLGGTVPPCPLKGTRVAKQRKNLISTNLECIQHRYMIRMRG
jgi:hypothetical protein